ncbi:crotonobetainyl-CoA:carnitine CoA-transferase CaiB-like acyl-CoA transferase [Antricoccus suffuscus]|uniref:Crotonobetainyl-CoA:carnitine CoA-transferase CaiB-like acyl-CoA transferase n=1 Tax=Antricoccus suffuscus TaxID=1629062 RepID=A0A2T1A6Z7_9ACTN|nr:CoA transferase [Antricoccus suffuscus]PRZ44247.1 crotonobetainyl-CoA:carnitine CoA-transferase CaiB-like acyl-CoA transferase [Antricoccus suffuscus]
MNHTNTTLTGPLSDIRVLDMTTAWAGPMASRSLAWLGADVIKIEAPGRPDGWRGFLTGGAAHHYPDLEHGARPYNRDLLFNTQNHDKRSLVLDLKAPHGRDVFLELAALSDIVVANFTPGVLDRLRIGYDDLAEVNDQIIVVEMPAFGSTGPMASHFGMGKTMEAACGMADLMGYGDDDRPVLTGPAILDPIGGLNAANAAVAALELRAETGIGCHIEVAQTEAAAHWIGELFLNELGGGAPQIKDGNRIPGVTPHEAFPALGDDQWVVVAARDEQEWQSLCEVIGRPDLAADSELANPDGRYRRKDDVESAVAEWTAQRDKRAAATLLQAAGVPAAPVCDGADVAGDPGLVASGMLQEITHPEAGTHIYPGLAYRLDRTPGGMSRPAPLFAEHNEEILSEMLSKSEEQIAALAATATISDTPVIKPTK